MAKPSRSFRILHSALCIAALYAATATPAWAAPTTANYVQDGLIACWDGIENASAGQHDPDATIWKDVVGGYEFALTGVTVDADRMTFAGSATSYGTLDNAGSTATFGAAKNGTMEIVFASSRGSGAQVLLQSTSDTGLAFGFYNGTLVPTTVRSPVFPFALDTTTNSVSIRYNASMPVSPIYANGRSLASSSTQDAWVNPSSSTTFIGVRATKANNTHFPGSIYCIRLYNRQLTDAEIAANQNMDAIRFSLDADRTLTIGSAPMQIGSPSPAYGIVTGLAAGETRTVSCGATPVADADGLVQYACTGWKLYNENVNIVPNGTGSETSFTYTHPSPAAYRRLEWQWEATSVKGTITAGAGGTVSPSGTAWYATDTPVTVTATPDAGKGFVRWTGTLPAGIAADAASVTFTPSAPFDMAPVFGTVFHVDHVAATTPDGTGASWSDTISLEGAFSQAVANDR